MNDAIWKVVHGRRPYRINGMPMSEHLRELEQAGFSVVGSIVSEMPGIDRDHLATRFKQVTDLNCGTSGIFFQAIPHRELT